LLIAVSALLFFMGLRDGPVRRDMRDASRRRWHGADLPPHHGHVDSSWTRTDTVRPRPSRRSGGFDQERHAGRTLGRSDDRGRGSVERIPAA